MTFKGNQGFRGTRTGAWAESKFTNLNDFDPADSEIERAYRKHYREIFKKEKLAVIVNPVHPAFALPLTRLEIQNTIASIPSEFTRDLKGIVCLSGSKKQERVFRNIFAYGRYFDGSIWLHRYPKGFMVSYYTSLPKPSILNDYKRAGAKIAGETGNWSISFDDDSLRDFYLRDVLLHEVGHHVDALNSLKKTHRKSEGYAEWFASEYGFRLRT